MRFSIILFLIFLTSCTTYYEQPYAGANLVLALSQRRLNYTSMYLNDNSPRTFAGTLLDKDDYFFIGEKPGKFKVHSDRLLSLSITYVINWYKSCELTGTFYAKRGATYYLTLDEYPDCYLSIKELQNNKLLPIKISVYPYNYEKPTDMEACLQGR